MQTDQLITVSALRRRPAEPRAAGESCIQCWGVLPHDALDGLHESCRRARAGAVKTETRPPGLPDLDLTLAETWEKQDEERRRRARAAAPWWKRLFLRG